jgi:hypothetical protein
MSFVSATWHGTIDFVRNLTIQARYYREPPSAETLARFAVDIRRMASDMEGPMPFEVRAFLAEFGGSSSHDAPAG